MSDDESIEIPVGSELDLVREPDEGTTDGGGRCRWCSFPPFFSFITLNIILIIFFAVSAITSAVLTNQNYSTSEYQNWILVGGLTSTAANFHVRRSEDPPESTEIFILSTSSDLLDADSAVETLRLSSITTQMVDVISVQGLQADTSYFYGTVVDGVELRSGSFKTAPAEGERTNFKFATAGCAYTGTKHEIFDQIRDENPLFFLHLGDFHYEGINEDSVPKRVAAIDKVMGSSSQRQLFETTGLSYMWDDHDWLGNNSGGEGEGRQAALDSYSLAFPHYSPLPSANATYHAYTIGTVRFIISDLRAESSTESIYSQQQKEWLFNELSQAASYDFVVWVTTKPWIGEAEEGQDSWFGQPEDRQELSDYITQTLSETQNLIAISADAHMVAFDSGVNTFYGTEEGPALSFPILQSGPLDRPGSVKGGPFSDGCNAYSFERNHQYSTVEFNGDGEEPCLVIKSYSTDARTGNIEQILDKTVCGQIFEESSPGIGSCDAQVWSDPVLVVSSMALGLLGLSMAISCFLGKGLLWNSIIMLTVIVWFVGTIAVGLGIPYSKGVTQYEQFEIAVIGLTMMIVVSLYLAIWYCCKDNDKLDEEDHIKPTYRVEEAPTVVENGPAADDDVVNDDGANDDSK